MWNSTLSHIIKWNFSRNNFEQKFNRLKSWRKWWKNLSTQQCWINIPKSVSFVENCWNLPMTSIQRHRFSNSKRMRTNLKFYATINKFGHSRISWFWSFTIFNYPLCFWAKCICFVIEFFIIKFLACISNISFHLSFGYSFGCAYFCSLLMPHHCILLAFCIHTELSIEFIVFNIVIATFEFVLDDFHFHCCEYKVDLNNS